MDNNSLLYCGNTSFTNCNFFNFVRGTSHGVYLHNIQGQLDHITFTRCQALTLNEQSALGPLTPYNSGGATPQYTFLADFSVLCLSWMECSWEATGSTGVGPKAPTAPGFFSGTTSISANGSNMGTPYLGLPPVVITQPLLFAGAPSSHAAVRLLDDPVGQFYVGYGIPDNFSQGLYSTSETNRSIRFDNITGTDGNTFTYFPYASFSSAGVGQTKASLSSPIIHAGLVTPPAPSISNVGSAGATTYTYGVSSVDASGNNTPLSATTSTTTGNASLSGSNYNVISFNNVNTGLQVIGATSFNVYRTAGGATQGLIGNVAATGNTITLSLNDTGLAASGSAPTVDATGTVQGGIINVGKATVSTMAGFDGSRNIVSKTAGVDYIAPGGAGLASFIQTSSVSVTNTVTETTLTGSGVGTLTIPANALVAGTTYRIRADGYMSDLLTPSLDVKFKFGSTAIDDTSATALVTLTGTAQWTYTGTVTCRTTGATGTVQCQGLFAYYNGTTPLVLNSPNTGTATIDTTASQAVTLTAAWGTANAANSITCTNLSLERIY